MCAMRSSDSKSLWLRRPLHNDICTEPTGEVDHEFSELHHRHVAEMAGRFSDHRDALIVREQRRGLGRVAHRRDDHGVEQPRRCRDDVEMTVVHRIERAWIHRHDHRERFPPDRAVSGEGTAPPSRIEGPSIARSAPHLGVGHDEVPAIAAIGAAVGDHVSWLEPPVGLGHAQQAAAPAAVDAHDLCRHCDVVDIVHALSVAPACCHTGRHPAHCHTRRRPACCHTRRRPAYGDAMRVVGGALGGRRLEAPGPASNSIRPTSDRAREAIFNMLLSVQAPNGVTVTDLFAGTGALGIEALSRGAAHATFVDDDAAACRIITANLDGLGLTERAAVHAAATSSRTWPRTPTQWIWPSRIRPTDSTAGRSCWERWTPQCSCASRTARSNPAPITRGKRGGCAGTARRSSPSSCASTAPIHQQPKLLPPAANSENSGSNRASLFGGRLSGAVAVVAAAAPQASCGCEQILLINAWR